jgi:hypothetical protein
VQFAAQCGALLACSASVRHDFQARSRRRPHHGRREGGELRLLHVRLHAPGEEEEALIDTFRAERGDEYAEVFSRTPAFLEELATEQARGRLTFAEVEEPEADLARLRAWLARIQARDYFDAPGRAEAGAAVEGCAQALADFAAAALAAESPAAPEQPHPAAAPRKRLRAAEDSAPRARGHAHRLGRLPGALPRLRRSPAAPWTPATGASPRGIRARFRRALFAA